MIKRCFTMALMGLFCLGLSACISLNRTPKAIHDHAVAYVQENYYRLEKGIERLQPLCESYCSIFEEDGVLWGATRDEDFKRHDPVKDDFLDSLFYGDAIEAITLYADGVIAIQMDGLGSIQTDVVMGFYYSPQDVPLWIDSGRFINDEDKYLYGPMIASGNGWQADKSTLTEEESHELRRYKLYTEKIKGRFYYYEAWI